MAMMEQLRLSGRCKCVGHPDDDHSRGGMLLWQSLMLILSVILLPSPAFTAPISIPPSKIFTNNLYNGPQDPSPAGVKSKWQTILSTSIVGIHIGHVPGTEKYLYVGRFSTSKQPVDNVIGVLDVAARSFKIINTDDNPFCCGVTATADGHVAVVGGNEKSATGLPDGLKSLRIYDPSTNPNRLPTLAKMSFNRWYPTGTLMANKNILVMGGTQSGSETGKSNSMFEVWDPPSNSVSSYFLDTTFSKGAGRVFYPFVYVLPTGDIFTHCDGYTRFLKPDYSYRPVFNIPSWPDASISTEYPRLGTSSISALYPPYDKVTVHVFGGASKNNKCDRTVVGDIMGPASTASFHLTMTWSGAGAGLAYNFNGGWKREEMPFPRVTFDSLLLPNGDILMTGGTQAGCSGDARLGVSRGNYPALWPVLYQPDKPAGQRFTVLSATGIARIYHGTALLTTDGLMLVSGCDSCNRARFKSNSPFLSKSSTGKKELRSELFYPPYALDTTNRPTITSVNGNNKQSTIVTVVYSATITITWNTAALKNAPISGVTLVATSQTTHGFNTNQRVVYLTILSQDAQAGIITVKTPPGPTVAPAQVYTLWLLNGKTYANKAWWVKLT